MNRYLVWGIIGCASFGVWRYVRHLRIERESAQLAEQLRANPVRHLGVIMDGNRRWARQHGYKPWIGHQHGVAPVKTAVQFCLKHQIKTLTLYVLSLENLQRPPEELHYLFDILAKEVAATEFQQLMDAGVRVTIVGDTGRIPDTLRPVLDDIVKKTQQNEKLELNLLLCYNGKRDLLIAVERCCREALEAGAMPNEVTEEWFMSHAWSSHVPAVDLIIRTGGEARLSNFLPWQSVYSNLYVLDSYWPDMTEQHFNDALAYYARCRKNMGK